MKNVLWLITGLYFYVSPLKCMEQENFTSHDTINKNSYPLKAIDLENIANQKKSTHKAKSLKEEEPLLLKKNKSTHRIEKESFLENLENGIDYAHLFLKKNPTLIKELQRDIDKAFINNCEKSNSKYETFLRQIISYSSWFPKDNKKAQQMYLMYFARLTPSEKDGFAKFLPNKSEKEVLEYLKNTYRSKKRDF